MDTSQGVEKINLKEYYQYIMPTSDLVDKQDEIYKDEEDRIKRKRVSNLRYARQPWTCHTCQVTINRSHKWDHERTKSHENYMSQLFN